MILFQKSERYICLELVCIDHIAEETQWLIFDQNFIKKVESVFCKKVKGGGVGQNVRSM